MGKYILKRILMVIPVLLGATFLVFFIMEFSPGDPVLTLLGPDATPEQLAEMTHTLGLDRPFFVRYLSFIQGILRGDLGTSYKYGLDVFDEIMLRLPNTLLLAGSAILLAVIVGIPVGIISAKKQYSAFDNITMVATLIGSAAPAFWLGLVFVMVFSLQLKWLPSAGMGEGFVPVLKSLIMPAVTLSMNTAAIIARQTRSSMLDVIRQDYIDTARSKGLSEKTITYRHMLKNALIPIITVVGLQFGILLGGSVMTETVFSWPGIGRYVIEAIKNKDIPCILGSIVVISVLFTLVNLFVDILYAFADPRIKAQYKSASKMMKAVKRENAYGK
ncbi:MAG: ABC transporter permease [Clostridia bacterium]|nr:ABC transporter permease [Clostridia bacterium]